MIINNNWILSYKYYPKIQAAENKPPVLSMPKNNEISNVYYQPIFTARKKEMSDEEFEQRYESLNKKFGDYGIPKTIVTKENIDFAEKLYDKGYAKEIICRNDYYSLIEHVNKDNKHFANKIIFKNLGHVRFYPAITTALPYVNKENEHIAARLCDGTFSVGSIEDIMSRFNKSNLPLVEAIFDSPNVYYESYVLREVLLALENDESGITALAELCLHCYDDYEEEPQGFPESVIPAFPQKFSPETIELFKQIYNNNNYDTANEIYHHINSENLDLVRWLQENKKDLSVINLGMIIGKTNKDNCEFVLNVLKSDKVSSDKAAWLSGLSYRYPSAIPYLEKELSKDNFDADKLYKYIENGYHKENMIKLFLLECGMDDTNKKIKHQEQLILKYPDKYLNNNDGGYTAREIENGGFYNSHKILFALLDKETLDVLFRKRINKAEKFSQKVRRVLEYKELFTLKKAFDCKTSDGKYLTPQEKLDLIEIICQYKKLNLDIYELQKMVRNNEINIEKLKFTMLKKIIVQFDSSMLDFNSHFSDNKLLLWNTDYAHLLSKTYNEIDAKTDQDMFCKLITMANSSFKFKDLIQNEDSPFAENNKNNKEEFKELGLDYDKWLSPPKKCEVHFVSTDKNTERIKQIANQLTEDIEVLRKSEHDVKTYIDKQLKHCIKDDDFVIPKEYYSNKNNMIKFILGADKQLEKVWKRAESNINNPKKTALAKQTLTIKNHIHQRFKDVSELPNFEAEKNMDITIKMWDRIPQKDLFQGNYSTCCIGMGESNAEAMNTYLMNTAFNMIELVDNNTGNVIGNALCYFVRDNCGHPELIIDNIEIRNSEKPSKEVGSKLRNAIKHYAQNVCKAVAGDKLPIWLGEAYNDVPTYSDLPCYNHLCSFVGDVSSADGVYLDAFGGWGTSYDISDEIGLFRM